MSNSRFKALKGGLNKSSKTILQTGQRHIVKFTIGGKNFIDELVLLEENEKAGKVKGLEIGVHWYEWDWIETNIRVLHVIPFKKKTLRDAMKIWIVKHL